MQSAGGDNGKRSRDVGGKSAETGLLSVFEREAKRSRMVSQLTCDTPKTGRNRDERDISTRFIMCHLKMLRSFHRQTNVSSADLQVTDDVWNQIQQYIHHRNVLVTKNEEARKLQGILHESKSVSQKPPLTAPLKRMNTSLKSQSKLSFSFITQSQQMQIHSLTLNSPSASSIREVNPSPARRFVQIRPSLSSNKNKTKMRTFNSMNLVTALLRRKYSTAVDEAKKEQEPFLPLLEKVQGLVKSLSLQITELKKKEIEVRNFKCLTEEDLFNMAVGEIEREDGCDDDVGGEEDEMVIFNSQVALWRALEKSLKSVLCD